MCILDDFFLPSCNVRCENKVLFRSWFLKQFLKNIDNICSLKNNDFYVFRVIQNIKNGNQTNIRTYLVTVYKNYFLF